MKESAFYPISSTTFLDFYSKTGYHTLPIFVLFGAAYCIYLTMVELLSCPLYLCLTKKGGSTPDDDGVLHPRRTPTLLPDQHARLARITGLQTSHRRFLRVGHLLLHISGARHIDYHGDSSLFASLSQHGSLARRLVHVPRRDSLPRVHGDVVLCCEYRQLRHERVLYCLHREGSGRLRWNRGSYGMGGGDGGGRSYMRRLRGFLSCVR